MRIDELDDKVFVYIDDEGPGIEENTAENLFNMAYQKGGIAGQAGLGLYFCRINVERWGGAIGCENCPGGGARFWFSLKKLIL